MNNCHVLSCHSILQTPTLLAMVISRNRIQLCRSLLPCHAASVENMTFFISQLALPRASRWHKLITCRVHEILDWSLTQSEHNSKARFGGPFSHNRRKRQYDWNEVFSAVHFFINYYTRWIHSKISEWLIRSLLPVLFFNSYFLQIYHPSANCIQVMLACM